MSAPLTLGPAKDLKMTIFFSKTEQKRTAPLSLDSVFHDSEQKGIHVNFHKN